MKRFFFWLVMVCGGGVLAWSVYAIEIGGLENVVQTIRNVVITSNGAVANPDKSNVIMNINDPQGNDANKIFIKKGAFRDGSILKEDIDWESIFSGNNYFSCAHKGEGYALQKMDYPNDATCVYVGDYRQPTDPKDKKGAIYYSGGVGIDIPGGVKKDSFVRSGKKVQGNAQFLVKDRLSPKGAIIVGKKDKYMTLSSDNGAAVLDVVNNVSGQKPQLVMGADAGVSIGGDVLMSNAKLSVHGNVHADKTLEIHDPTKGSMKTSVSSDKTTITLTNKNFFIGGGVKDTDATKISRRGSVAHAWSWSDAGLVVGSTNSSSTPHAPLTVNGGLSVRGQGEKGGVGIGGFVGTVDLKSSGCRVASIDATGKVVMKAVAGCYYGIIGSWGSCSSNGTTYRSFSCKDGSGATVARSLCNSNVVTQASCKVRKCGSADNVNTANKPTTNLCDDPSYAASVRWSDHYKKWSWQCRGEITSGPSRGSSIGPVNNCEAKKSIAGSCGGAHGTIVDAMPTSNLCADGSKPAVSWGNGSRTWTCAGSNGGSHVSCSAQKPQPTYDIYTCQDNGTWSAPRTNQTNIGGITQYGSGPYSPSTKVYVTAGATKPSDGRCTKKTPTPTPVAGVCGTADGKSYTSAPATSLRCSVGSVINFSGGTNGSRKWNCRGVNGGATSKQCEATKKATPVVTTTYDIYTCQDTGVWSKTSTGVTSTTGSSVYRTSQKYKSGSKVHVTAGSAKPADTTCNKKVVVVVTTPTFRKY